MRTNHSLQHNSLSTNLKEGQITMSSAPPQHAIYSSPPGTNARSMTSATLLQIIAEASRTGTAATEQAVRNPSQIVLSPLQRRAKQARRKEQLRRVVFSPFNSLAASHRDNRDNLSLYRFSRLRPQAIPLPKTIASTESTSSTSSSTVDSAHQPQHSTFTPDIATPPDAFFGSTTADAPTTARIRIERVGKREWLGVGGWCG